MLTLFGIIFVVSLNKYSKKIACHKFTREPVELGNPNTCAKVKLFLFNLRQL